MASGFTSVLPVIFVVQLCGVVKNSWELNKRPKLKFPFAIIISVISDYMN